MSFGNQYTLMSNTRKGKIILHRTSAIDMKTSVTKNKYIMLKLQHYDSALFITMLLTPVIYEDTCITVSFHSERKLGSIKGINQATLFCRNACTKQGE